MPINLKEHAVFIERLQMEMVPLSIAEKAVEDALLKIEETTEMIEKSLLQINKTISEND